jgi:hypothetical protein
MLIDIQISFLESFSYSRYLEGFQKLTFETPHTEKKNCQKINFLKSLFRDWPSYFGDLHNLILCIFDFNFAGLKKKKKKKNLKKKKKNEKKTKI